MNVQTKKIYIILLIAFHHWTIEKIKAKTVDRLMTWEGPVSRKPLLLFGPEIKYSNRNKTNKSTGPG